MTRAASPKILLAALAVASWLLFAASASVAHAAACPQAFGSFGAGAQPPGCWRPYGPSSPFNRQLPADPRVAADSARVMSFMLHNHDHFQSSGNSFAFTSDGRDGVYFSQPSDPLVTVDCTAYWGPNTCQGENGVDVNGMQIHIPANAQPEPGNGDRHLTVIDQADGVEYDFETAVFSPDHQTVTVYAASQIPIGADQGTGLGSQGTAAHMATLAGLVTAPELASGQIDHALAVSVPCTDGYVWPAIGAFGYGCSQLGETPSGNEASPPLGALLQLNMTDAQIAATAVPRWEQTIMRAMAHYGMYVNDTGGSGDGGTISVEVESDVSYTSLGGQPELGDLLKSYGGTYWGPGNDWIVTGPQIPLSKVRVIDTCVAQGTCPSAPAAHIAGVGRRHATRHRARVVANCRRTVMHGHGGRLSRRYASREVAACVRWVTRRQRRHRHRRG